MIARYDALLVVLGAVVAAAAAVGLGLRARDARWGRLASIDVGGSPTLRSDRYRLTGRPDAVRRAPDGRSVPVEVKHRPAPRAGPFPSHLVQLWAYCLLLEEADGRPPAFGVLRYDDREIRVVWDAAARAELLAVRRAVDRPYDGRATPSPGRCARCRWADRCDARAAGPGTD